MDKFTPEQINISNSFDEKDKTLYNKYRVGGLGVDQALNAVVEVKTGKPQPKAPLLQRVAEGTLDILGGKELAQGAGQVLASPFVNKLSEETRVQQEGVAKQLIERIKLAREEGDVAKINKWTELLGGLDYGADISKGFQEDLVTDKEVIGSSLKLAGTAGGGFVGGNLMRGGTIASAGGKLTKATNLIPEGAIGNIIKGVVAEGAIQGGSFGLGDSVSRGDNLQDTAINTIKNTAFGAGTGLALGKTFQFGGRLLTGKAGAVAEKVVSKKASKLSDYISTKPTTEAETRALAEATAPSLSVKEKYIGLNTDVKKRLMVAGEEKTQKYIDVAKARNLDDTVPTPYEYGAKQADEAASILEQKLNETGGIIGNTRKKLGTYKANIDQVTKIENSFNDQLSKLNLELKNGVVVKKTNAISSASSGDIKVLNEILENFQVVKKDSSLTNLIDFRTAVDSKINFGKRAAEVSNQVDPLARFIRKNTADVAAEIVGKTEAAELAKYSQFMDAYSDLKSYTDRKAGGEYLLKQVLSGRGGEAREIIATIKKYTGIDLLDDATLMTLVTDKLGNTAQKNLFRQEILNAGMDAKAILSGDIMSTAINLSKKGIDNFIDAEKVIINASKTK